MALLNAASPSPSSHSSLSQQQPQTATAIPSSASSPVSPTQQAPFTFASPTALSNRPRALSLPSLSSSTTSQTVQDAFTEREFCKDIFCCGIHLTDLHQLQIHGELFHSFGGTSVAALASLIELRRVSFTSSAFAPTSIVSMTRRNGVNSLKSSRRTSTERTSVDAKPQNEDILQLPVSVSRVYESASLAIPSSSISAPDDVSRSPSLSSDPAATDSTAIVNLESGVENELKIGFDYSDNEETGRKVDSLLQPPHTLPPDESDVVTITFEEEQESPPRDVIGSEILATSRNLFSGCSPLLVAAHPIISLKDIYNDTNVLEGVDADYVLRGIFSLDADESSGPTVADRSGDDTDSDSLMSDMDCDYENCDDDEGLRVMTSVAASRATHSSPNKPPLSLQRQELNVHAHNGRTLRHAPHVDYSPYAQPLPQQPRRRGRPRLNRYLLPPSHPKYLPMPAMTPIPSGGNEASSSNPAPIRIKLRLGSVTATVTDMTLAPAGPPGSAPASEHPLSPPQSVSSSAEQLADPMQQMIPLDEQLLATLGPAASAAMRRRMREGIRAITAQELMAATMPLAPGQTLTRTGNPPAPPPLGPDGKPIKRGRGRPRKRPRPEDGLLPPPPPQLPSRPPLRPQRQAAVVPGPIVETPEEILDETGYEFEFASSDPALPQGSDETNNYVESSALVSDSHQPESVDVPEPIEEPARVSDINESVPEEDLQAMDAALSPDLIWVEEGKLATECDIAAPSSVTASPSEGVSAPLTSVALTAGPASSKRKGKDTKKRRQTAHSLDADVSRLEPPAKKAKTIFAPSSRRRQSAPAQEAIEIIADENVDVNLGKETHDDPRAAEQDCLLVDPSSEAPAQPIDATFSVAPENVANHREVLKKLHVYHLKIQDAANKRKTDAQTLGARSGPPPDIVHSLSLISAHNARKRALHASMNTTSSTECGSSSAGESNASPLVSIAAYSDLPALLYAANPVVLTGRRLKLGALALVPPGTNEKRYICPGCGKDYKNANGVKYHLNREHNDAKGIPVLLLGGGIDGVSSSNVADGGDEDNEEEGEGLFVADLVSDKPFLCFLDHCEKPFKSLAGLRYHMRSLHASYLTESEHEKILQAYNLADDSAFRVTPTGSATSFAASATTTLISKEKTLSSAKSTQISVAGTGQKASNRNDRKRKMRPSPESNDEVVAIPVSDEDMVGEPAIIPSVTKRVNVDLGALLFDSDGENDEVEEEVDELAESEDAQEDEDRQLRKGKSASASSAAVVTDRRRSSRVSR
ncbi:hypothetical protein BC830DRAFT_1232447 [Chytriomyces sp. MP71]|nr:hypothetical protein BC830DRAFT_1232447 [Chytriomyces sp. MP71]